MGDIKLTLDGLAGHLQKTVDPRLMTQVPGDLFNDCCSKGHNSLVGIGQKKGMNGPQ